MSRAPDVPMPKGIAALDRDHRGYPIFYAIQQPTGGYDFKAIVWDQVQRCAERRLCGLCGRPLGYWIVFIGGPKSCQNRWFSDPPMHRECAEYAWQVCPYLLRGGYDRSHTERARRVAQEDPTGYMGKPEKMGFFTTRSYEWKQQTRRHGFDRVPFGQELFKAAPATQIEWREPSHGHDHPRTEAEPAPGAAAGDPAAQADAARSPD